ncbi:MAG TPA: DUF4389 domain-containing protein [Pseudomonas xinjiangensis]|uniref:DUF4389 domain-containing protein n=2 Tax=root TaxID=1 RepID=A0A7V1BRA2_9GAMM|nr:DUF4389 domain-containing protein [Halopseudomonas xinjiangensis]HEC49416.1 DUF4389 domain-containing protein [Halopseudomonas xinjiangensis]
MKREKAGITSADFWLRLIYVLLFGLAWQVAEVLLLVVAVLQLGFRAVTDEADPRLAGLGNSLSQYAWQIGRYVTGSSEQKPWPFMEWPDKHAQWGRVVDISDRPVNPDRGAADIHPSDGPSAP